MSRSVDSRIVEMKFENGKFKNDIKETIDSLTKLKKETDFKEVQASAKNFDLSKVRTEVESLKFTFKDVFRLTVFQDISNTIIGTFKSAFSKVTSLYDNMLSTIKNKGWARATNIDQAKFQLKGLGIAWQDIGNQISAAVDGTAYGLDSAARAASQLAASSVKIGAGFKDVKIGNDLKKDVDEMERALGAISGIAAMTNSQYDEIADIFTAAAGRGKVTADTFNRIAARGLNSAAALAKAMGKSEAEVKDLASKGKISFQEFSDAMYEAFYEHAKDANNSFEGSLSNMQSALGRIGAEFSSSIRHGMIEPFNALRELINKVKKTMADSGLFEYFDKLAMVVGRIFANLVKSFANNDKNFEWVTNLADAFKNLVEVIVNIAIPIKDAFESIFGRSIIDMINDFTKGIANFTKNLMPTGDTLGYIRMGFEGFFSILKSLSTIIKTLIYAFTGLNLGGNSLLGWLGRGIAIGIRFVSLVLELLVNTIDLNTALGYVSQAFSTVVQAVGAAIAVVGGGLIYAFNTAKATVSGFMQTITSKVGAPSTNPFVNLLNLIITKIKGLPSLFPKLTQNVKDFFKAFNSANTVGDKIKVLMDVLSKLKIKIGNVLDGIADSIRKIGGNNLLTNFIASVVSGIKVIVQNIGTFAAMVGGVIVLGLTKAAEAIKNFFTTFINNVKSFNGNVILSFFKTFVDTIKNFGSNIPSALNGVKNFFSQLSIFDKIRSKLSAFKDFLSRFVNYIKTCFQTMGTVTVYAAEVDQGIEKITNSSSQSKWNTSGIQSFIDKLKEFVEAGGLVKIAILGINGVLIALMIKLGKFLTSITGLTDSLGGITKSVKKISDTLGDKGLAGMLKNASGSLKKFLGGTSEASKETPKIDTIAKAILKLAASMGILIAALMALTLFMEKHDIAGAGSAMVKLAGGILVFAGVLGVLNKFFNLDFIFKFSKAMILMAASILILVKAMEGINVDETLGSRLLSLAAIMGLLTGFSFILSKAAPSLWKGAASLLLFAAAIKVFSKILAMVPSMEANLKNFVAFGAALVLGAIIIEKGINRFSRVLKNLGVMILSIAASVAILCYAVQMMGNYTGDVKKGITVVGALFAFVSIVGVLSSVLMKVLGGGEMAKFGITLLAVAGAVAILTKIAVSIGAIPLDQLLKGTITVGVFLVLIASIMAASALTEKAHPVKFAIGLTLITGCISLLLGLAVLTGKLNPNELIQGGLAVGALIVLIGLLMVASAMTAKANFGAIIAAIIGVSVIMGEILLLSNIKDWKPIETAMVHMGAVMLGFGVLMALIGKGNYNKGSVGALITTVAAVTVLAGSLYLLASKIESPGSLIAALVSLVAIMATFAKLLSTIGAIKFKASTLQGMLIGALIIGEIGFVLFTLVSTGDWLSLLTAGIAISAVLTSFGDLLSILSSKTGLKPEKINNFLKASLALLPIGAALFMAAQGDWNSVLFAGVAMSAALYTFGKVLEDLSSMKKIKPENLQAFLLASLAFLPIGLALFMAAQADWGSILAAGAAMSGALIVLTGVLDFISKSGASFDIKQIGMLLLGSLSLIEIGYALSLVAKYDWQSIVAAGAMMSVALIAVVAALAVLGGLGANTLMGAAGLIGAAAGMILLGIAMQQFVGLDWTTIGMAGAILGGLTLALVILGAAIAVTGPGVAILIALAGALVIMSIAMNLAAVAMLLFTPSLVTLSTLPLAEIGAGLIPLAGGLALLGAAGIALALATLPLTAASLYMGPLAAGLDAMSRVGDLSHIPGPLALIAAAGIALGLAAAGMVAGSIAMTALAAAVTLLGLSVNKASAMVSAGITLIVSTLKMGVKSIRTSCDEIGTNVGAGMLNGIKDSAPKVVKGALAMANGLVDGIKNTLGIHSPSKVMQWLGNMCGVGFDEGSNDRDVWNGIKAKITENLNKSIIEPAKKCVEKLKNAFSGLGDTISSGAWKDKLPTSITDLTDKLDIASYSTTNLDEIFNKLGFDTEETTSSLDGMSDSMGGLEESTKGAGKAASETKDAFTELKDKIAQQIDIFSEFEKKTEMTSDKILENMKSQIQGVAEWSNMMNTLAIRGINQGLLQKLADLGPQGYEYVHAFVTMTDDQLSQANALYTQSLLIPDSAAKQVMNSFATAGMWATYGFENGLDMDKFRKSGIEGAMAVRDGLEGNKGLQIHSPSRIMFANGQYAIMGFINGLNDKTPNLIARMEIIAKNVINTFKNNASQIAMFSIGSNAIQGLIDGMVFKEASLKSTVNRLSGLIEKVSKKTLNEHSPSRVMKQVGAYATEGLAIGLESKENLVTNATENVASTAIVGLKDAIKAISKMEDLGLDLNPTITPILDLSNVEAGSAELNKMTNGWNDMSIGVSSDLANKSSTSFNNAVIAKANLAYETQNGIDMLRSAINALGSNETNMTQNNTFNISGDDPRAIADEVSRVLQMQVERRGAVWA